MYRPGRQQIITLELSVSAYDALEHMTRWCDLNSDEIISSAINYAMRDLVKGWEFIHTSGELSPTNDQEYRDQWNKVWDQVMNDDALDEDTMNQE